VQGQFTQPVRVRPQDVSVHLSSYPGDGQGDRAVEAPGTQARLGGSASVRAVTRVKPEQASKSLMRAPSPLSMDEAAAVDQMHRQMKVDWLAGVGGTARTHARTGNTGGLSARWGDLPTALQRGGRDRRRRGS